MQPFDGELKVARPKAGFELGHPAQHGLRHFREIQSRALLWRAEEEVPSVTIYRYALSLLSRSL
jgi:hypothetical protein